MVCRIQTKASAQQRLRFRIEQTVRRTTAEAGLSCEGSTDQRPPHERLKDQALFRVKLSETTSRHLDEWRSPSLDLAEDKVLRRARVSSACQVWREHKQQRTAASTLCNVKSSDRMYSPGWPNPLGRKFSCEATKSHTAASIG